MKTNRLLEGDYKWPLWRHSQDGECVQLTVGDEKREDSVEGVTGHLTISEDMQVTVTGSE